jgi:integrase
VARREWGSGTICRRTVTRNGKQYHYWRAIAPPVLTGLPRRLEKETRTEKAARAWLRAFSGGDIPNRISPRLSEYADKWLTGQRRLVSAGQFGLYQANVRHHFSDFEHLPLNEITPQHVRDLIETRQAEEYAPRTIHGIVGTLRAILNQAMADELVSRNVAALVKLPKLQQKTPAHFTAAQVRRFLDASDGDSLSALWAVALGCGLRRSELLALTWRDIDLDGATVRVASSKTSAGVRTLPLPPFAAVRLADRRRESPSAGPIWRYDPAYVSRHFGELCEKAGVPRLPFHSTRHTFASLMLDAGVDPLTIQSLLGHSKPSMSAWYARAGEEKRRDAVERLGKVVAG